jgi:hypothetical protein
MPFRTLLLLITMITAPVWAQKVGPLQDSLFHIERSKNANIVQYDALVDESGDLLSKEPITGYWIRHAEQGQVEELSWAQKKLAYGFKVKLKPGENIANMELAAKLGRSITIMRSDKDYKAVTDIEGVASYLDRIFIHSSGKGLSTKVDYIELFGQSVSDQTEQYERFIPNK